MQLSTTPVFALLLTSLVSINGSPLPAVINNELNTSSLKTFNPKHSSNGAGSHEPLQIVARTPDFKLHTPKNRNSTKKAGFNKQSNHTTKAGSKKIATRAAVKLPKILEKLAKLFTRDPEIELRSTGIQLNSTHSHHNGTKTTGRHNSTTRPTSRDNSTSKANFKSHSNHTSKAGFKVSKRVAVKLPKILEKIAKLFSRSIDSPNTYPENISIRAAVKLPKLLEKLAKLFTRDENTISTRAAVHLPSWLSKLAKFFRRDVGIESTTSAKLNATRAHAHNHKNHTKSVKFANKYAAREILDPEESERDARFGSKTAAVFKNLNTRNVAEGSESANEEAAVKEVPEQKLEEGKQDTETQDDSEDSQQDSQDSDNSEDAEDTDEEQAGEEEQEQDDDENSSE